MPSSLIFAALAAAWLVVLVPMVARRRQEVARTADSALAARVVRRGSAGPAQMSSDRIARTPDRDDEFEADDYDPVDVDYLDEDDVTEDEYGPTVGYRRGRGGFDPDAATAQAHRLYARRQRLVVLMLVGALVTAFAAFAVPTVWWPHVLIDLVLIAYLSYLRRQVRIEDDIRRRRTARMATRRAIAHAPRATDRIYEAARERMTSDPRPEPTEPVLERRPPLRPRSPLPDADVVELDDEDPAFDELEHFAADYYYRRASGQ